MSQLAAVTPDSPAALIDRELSWLSFARRVLALAEDPEQPLLERVKFAGIMGMIYDEFAMKRIGGLLRRVRPGGSKRGPEGLTPAELLEACRAELGSQQALVARLVEEQLRPALLDLGTRSWMPGISTRPSGTSSPGTSSTPWNRSSPPLPRTPRIRFRSSATSASTWRYWSPNRAAGTTVSCGSRFRPTGRDGCRCRTTRVGCPSSR